MNYYELKQQMIYGKIPHAGCLDPNCEECRWERFLRRFMPEAETEAEENILTFKRLSKKEK